MDLIGPFVVRGGVGDVYRHNEDGDTPAARQAATVLRRACSGVRIISQKILQPLYTSTKSTSWIDSKPRSWRTIWLAIRMTGARLRFAS
jgi:hypothetical protein